MRCLRTALVCLSLSLCLHSCQAFQCSSSPYTTQIPEYVVCPNENKRVPNYDVSNTEGCDRTSSLLYISCDDSRPSPVSVCWRVQDYLSGTVEVTLPLLPQRCNYTRYDVTLVVLESATCPSPGSDHEFKKHSRKEIILRECSEDSCASQCKERVSVTFYHVFSGCYQLFITPRRHLTALQQLLSDPLMLHTEYNKTSLSAATPVIFFSPKQADLTLKVKFPIVPASAHLTLSHSINTSLGLHACRLTGVPVATCVTCLGSSEIRCDYTSSDAANFTSCSYQGDSVVWCSFPGMKPGNYCVRVQYDDERCVADTVWNDVSDENRSPCTWDTFKQYVPSLPATADSSLSESSVNPTLLVLLVLAVMGACGIGGFVFYRRTLPSYPKFLPVRHKAVPLSDQPIVLLLYARDCPPFLQAVTQLRTVMRKLYNCQVMDCWDDNQFGAVSQSPARWLQMLLNNTRVRCVLVTSPASLLLEAALMRNIVVRYSQPRAFDCVLTHALTTLHETCLQDSYKRLFIVRFDTGVEGSVSKTRTYLNPLTTFVLPIHLNKLMSTLYNLDSTMCTITADSQTEVELLADAINEYRRYLVDNPHYLDTLMTSDIGASVHQILV